ncbi:MAG: hypothetical protein MZV70_51650 [Desulfobacterales bacterium]|nr:hypothetical protein [Desulfobacterales bacterium]
MICLFGVVTGCTHATGTPVAPTASRAVVRTVGERLLLLHGRAEGAHGRENRPCDPAASARRSRSTRIPPTFSGNWPPYTSRTRRMTRRCEVVEELLARHPGRRQGAHPLRRHPAAAATTTLRPSRPTRR